jgi:hypothetical protein
MVDISRYAARVHDAQDRPLFDDAVKSAAAGALRGAYVMLWLSCAESLKRKFREAGMRDANAGKIVGEIAKKEEDQRSVDKFILEKSKEYGFISESAFKILLHIYELRCVYGHPYEEAPDEEQVTHAAAMVVQHVLSQPVRLRQGYCKTLLKSLMEEKHFLDDQASAVHTFASEILPKIDESVYGWFLDAYWKELEKYADDSSLNFFFLRGIRFTRAVLTAAGGVFTAEAWHAKVGAYPKTLIRVLNCEALFKAVGERAQDSLVGSALDIAQRRASVLQHLERLMEQGALTERQKERFIGHVGKMPTGKLRSAKLSTKTIFKRLIGELKSRNWYVQQPMIDIIVANCPEQIDELEAADQATLGRNILQVADGDERSAKRFLRSIADEPTKLPVAFLRGIFLECFVNEEKKVRLKCEHLSTVLKIVGGLDDGSQGRIVERATNAIEGGTPKGIFLGKKAFSKVCSALEACAWAAPVTEALKAMRDGLVSASVEDD